MKRTELKPNQIGKRMPSLNENSCPSVLQPNRIEIEFTKFWLDRFGFNRFGSNAQS